MVFAAEDSSRRIALNPGLASAATGRESLSLPRSQSTCSELSITREAHVIRGWTVSYRSAAASAKTPDLRVIRRLAAAARAQQAAMPVIGFVSGRAAEGGGTLAWRISQGAQPNRLYRGAECHGRVPPVGGASRSPSIARRTATYN